MSPKSPGFQRSHIAATGHLLHSPSRPGGTTQRAAIRAATLGLGLIRCLRYEAHAELRSGLLVPVLQPFASQGLPAQLIYRHGRRAEARVRSFIDFAVPLPRGHPAFGG